MKRDGKTLRKTMGTAWAIKTKDETKARRRMFAEQTGYGKVTTSRHATGCGVWIQAACDCQGGTG